MSIPSIVLGIIISTLLGALFHVWRGGNAGRLLFYLVLAWFGFWTGQFIGNYFNFTFDLLGQLHIAMAILGSLFFLAVGYWLSLVQVEKRAG